MLTERSVLGASARSPAKRKLEEVEETDVKEVPNDLCEELRRVTEHFLRRHPATRQLLHGDPRFDAHVVDTITGSSRKKAYFAVVRESLESLPYVSTGQSERSPAINLERDYLKVFDCGFGDVFQDACSWSKTRTVISALDEDGRQVGRALTVNLLDRLTSVMQLEFQRKRSREEGKRFLIFADARAQKWPHKSLMFFDNDMSVVLAFHVVAGTDSGLMNRGFYSETSVDSMDSSSYNSTTSESSSSSVSSAPPSPSTSSKSSDFWSPAIYRGFDVTGAAFFPGVDAMTLLLCKGAVNSMEALFRLQNNCRVEIYARRSGLSSAKEFEDFGKAFETRKRSDGACIRERAIAKIRFQTLTKKGKAAAPALEHDVVSSARMLDDAVIMDDGDVPQLLEDEFSALF